MESKLGSQERRSKGGDRGNEEDQWTVNTVELRYRGQKDGGSDQRKGCLERVL
jgi:hypothetical protein